MGPLIVTAINGSDPDRKSVATLQIANVSATPLKYLVEHVKDLPSASQAIVQAVAAARMDRPHDKTLPKKKSGTP